MSDRIEIEGLRELRRAVRATKNAEDAKEIRDAGRSVAEQIVIPSAKSHAAGVTHHNTGRSAMFTAAAATMKPASIIGGGGIRYGGGLRWAMGAEFGSLAFDQFNAWRGNDEGAGWFLWPAIRDETPRIVETYGEALEAVFDRNWVST